MEERKLQFEPDDFEIADKGKFIINNNVDYKKKLSIKSLKGKPIFQCIILLLIVFSCLFSEAIINHNPVFMDLNNINISPNKEFYFGTDSMGRDIFSMIFYGGRISLFIGFISTIISTTIGVLYGTLSGLSNELIDNLMMRIVEIILSIPSILIIIFVQGILGKNNTFSISIVIGITSWMNIAKVVRSEVLQIKSSEYIIASKIMGGNFFYILFVHLLPNFIASIMFMVVTNISSAIATESTLSFLGIGLPIEIISWGSMLSLSSKALLSNYWWIIVIPGVFLVVTLVCIANIGDYLRRNSNKKFNNL